MRFKPIRDSANNPLRYVDPSGHYYVEYGWDGTKITSEVIVVGKGDTLSQIAQSYYGDSSVWTQFGYTEKQVRSIQPGTRIDVTNIVFSKKINPNSDFDKELDRNAQDKFPSRDKKKHEKEQVGSALGRDREKREAESQALHDEKIRSGVRNDDNRSFKDLKNGNYGNAITPQNSQKTAVATGTAVVGGIVVFKIIKAIIGGAIAGPPGVAVGAAF